jgi:integrase/recombinase XerD
MVDPANAEVVERFLEGRGLAKGSAQNYRIVLEVLDRFIQGHAFREVSEDDLRRFMRTRTIAARTRNHQIILLKTFFRWLHGYRKYMYPPVVAWLHGSGRANHLPVVSAQELFTEGEIRCLLEATYSTRDRAMWMVLWEGALRLGEALAMTVGAIIFDEYGCYCLVDGKTGQRRIRFVQATPYLREWLNVHPRRDQSASWLWTQEHRDRPLHPSTLRDNLTAAAKRAGIRHRVWPHLFRHSRLTLNAKFMTEAELCVFAGWRQGSPQTRVYVHLSGSDLDDKVLAHYGLKEKEQINGEQVLQPRACPRCAAQNPATGTLCYRCGSYLDLKTAMLAEQDSAQRLKTIEAENQQLREMLINVQIDVSKLLAAQTSNEQK